MGDSYLDLLMAQEEDTFEEAAGGGGVWVVADIADDDIAPVTLEAIGAARNLADSLGAYVYGVLLGEGVTDRAQMLYQAGADGVRVADHPALADFAVEPYLELLADLFEEEGPEIVLFGATDVGQALAPRLAQRMGGGLIEHVTAVSLDESTRAVEAAFPIYGGEYFEIVACSEARPQFLTIEPGVFPKPYLDEYRKGDPTVLEVGPSRKPEVRMTGPAEGFDPPAIPLSEAAVIVSIGRQIGDPALAERLTSALNARMAGDRGAWDAGMIASEQIVDVRGVSVAPEIYVAVGIRGDTFHDAAMEGAKFVAAIHPDPTAPIFEVADLCMEADPQEILPHLLEALEA